jgi:TolB-like protein
LPGPEIFLSYNREDAGVAKLFADAFLRQGMDVWWDQTLRSGETYDEVTEAALRGAKAVVVLWSPRSVASHWVRAEATIAHRAKTLVPAIITPCDKPVMFELTQTADLSHWRGEAEDSGWLAFLGDVRRMVSKDSIGVVEAKPTPELPSVRGGMPLVAVLPIIPRGGGEELEYLAEDLTEDITRELGRCPYFKLISANSMATWRGRPVDHATLIPLLGARYLVESKLQGGDAAVRLTVDLVDTSQDNVLWSSRFTCKLGDIQSASEPFSRSVVAELTQTIGQFEMNEALTKQAPYTAWDRLLRSWANQTRRGQSSALAVEEARHAVSAAPDSGLAHATLAFSLTGRLQSERLTLGDAELSAMAREAQAASIRAMDLDDHNPAVLTRLAQAYATLGDAEAGLRLASRAVSLNPASAEAQYTLGFTNFMLGHTADAIEAFSKDDCIAWSDASRMAEFALLGICLFIEGRTAEGEARLDASLALQPNFYLGLRWKAVAAAELGNEESAKAAIRLLRKSEPGKTVNNYLDSLEHLPIEHPRKYEAIEILRRLLEESEQGE